MIATTTQYVSNWIWYPLCMLVSGGAGSVLGMLGVEFEHFMALFM